MTEVAAQAMALRQASTQAALQAKFVKMNAQAEASLANMIEAVIKAAPQPGQGGHIDKSA